jgi:hypothetical protein
MEGPHAPCSRTPEMIAGSHGRSSMIDHSRMTVERVTARGAVQRGSSLIES